MRISDWSSDVCSSDLRGRPGAGRPCTFRAALRRRPALREGLADEVRHGPGYGADPRGGGGGDRPALRASGPERCGGEDSRRLRHGRRPRIGEAVRRDTSEDARRVARARRGGGRQRREPAVDARRGPTRLRSEEHTSELQSLMRISYAVFCLKKKKYKKNES